MEQLNEHDMALFKAAFDGYPIQPMSSIAEENVSGVRNGACDLLMAQRLEQKFSKSQATNVLEKLNVALPRPRDAVARPATIPRAILEKTTAGLPVYDFDDPNRRLLERDLEVQHGGHGAYNIDLKKNYLLDNEAWKYDPIPEIMDGRNVADFVDEDIMQKLIALEKEEEAMMGNGDYNISLKNPVATKLKSIAHSVSDRRIIAAQLRKLNRKTFKANKLKPKKLTREMNMSEDSESDVEMNDYKPAIVKKSGAIKKMEADRRIIAKMPKHLFSGKRGQKADRR
jgi:nucleolar GTP-binding protein